MEQWNNAFTQISYLCITIEYHYIYQKARHHKTSNTTHKSPSKHRRTAKQKQATLIASHGPAAVAAALKYTFTHWHFQCLTHISMYTVSCSGRSTARTRYGAACCRSVHSPAAKIWLPLAGRAAAGWPCRWAPLAGCEIWRA